jgi:hypothetical protein
VCSLSALQKKFEKKQKNFRFVKKRYTFDLTLIHKTMGTKNEIQIVSKQLIKHLVRMTTTIEIEVYVYAEDKYKAEALAEQEVCVTEYANDTIGIEINRNWDCDINREGDQKFELERVSSSGYVEAYDSEEYEMITLYAREEDGFEDSENVFISEEDLLEKYKESDED